MNWQAEHFWQWSCDYYPKVKQKCLLWQDEYGANVNMLLLAVYLSEHGFSLTMEMWRQLAASVAQSARSLAQIREQRKGIKGHDMAGYQDWLNKELQLERQQQQALIEQLNQLDIKPGNYGQPVVNYLSLIVDPAILARGQWRYLLP